MRISHSSLTKYIEKLNDEIKEEKLFSPVLLNNRTLVFPLMERNKKVLVFSLNPKTPLLFKTNNDCFFSSFENSFLQRFRKYYGKTIVKNIEISKNDLVLNIELYSIDEFEAFSIIFEAIPNRTNLIIIDKDKTIKDHFFKLGERPIKVGDKYIQLENKKLIDGEIEVNDDLFNKIIEEEFVVRTKEKYAEFVKFIKNKIKTANKKILAIENDVNKAEANLKYKDIADYILSSGLNLKSHVNSFDYFGELITLDSSKTLLENAQGFYKKVKKSKETISRSQINIENAKKESIEYSQILNEFDNANERKKDELVSIYSISKKKKEVKPTIVNRAWKINYNGTIIYFGRNASQNDYLSFVMKLDREFTWMHIKDKSGAHLVIANKKPTEAELLIAAEISLLCSRATAGEVDYTKKKNVRRGHILGEALLKNHSTIKLNNIRKETIELFETAVRCD